MELLSRYLNAVAAQLPEDQRDSITLELREELLSRMEERSAALRRPLNEREAAEVLKSCGHPLIVAAGYRQQRHLLSPPLLPFYWFATRVIIGTDLAAHLAYVVVAVLFGASPGHVLVVCEQSLWSVTMYHIGIITFSALILDRLAGRLLARTWNPRWLPGPRGPGQAILALDAACLLVAVLLASGAAQSLLPPGAVQIRPGPVWHYVGPVLVVAAVIQLDIHLLQRFMLLQTPGIRLAKVIQGILLLAVAVVAAGARPWIEVAGMPPAAAHAVSRTLDTSITIALGAAMIVAAVMIARNALRLMGVLIRAP